MQVVLALCFFCGEEDFYYSLIFLLGVGSMFQDFLVHAVLARNGPFLKVRGLYDLYLTYVWWYRVVLHFSIAILASLCFFLGGFGLV